MPPVVESAEDIKAGPEQPKDLRSAQEIALTKHLDAVEVPEDADDGVDLSSVKLPKTLKLTHALLQEILAIEPTDARGGVVKRAKLAYVRAHLFQLEQGGEPPVIKMADHKAITGAQSNHANAFKLNELARVHPEVKALMDERDSLSKKVAELSQKA